MIFTITNAGLVAANNAQAGGPKINLTTFKVGSSVNYTPLVTDTDLHGTVLHTQAINGYAVISPNEVEYTLTMDDTVGDFSFGEVGIYMEDGTLFALGTLIETQAKRKTDSVTAGNIVSFEARLLLTQIAATITFPINQITNARMIEIPSVDSLKPPSISDTNAYITLSKDVQGSSIPAFRTGDFEWSFPTFSKIYQGVVTGNGQFYTTASIELVGGGGSGAAASATLGSGAVTSINRTAWGSGYTAAPAVVITGDGNGAEGIASITQGVVSAAIANAGAGYSSAPTVTFMGGGGTGAAATATISGGVVTGITITNPGKGYTSAPTIALSGGGGSGATASATISGVVDTIAVSRNTTNKLVSAGLDSAASGVTAGKFIIQFNSGVLAGYCRLITESTPTTLTWNSASPMGSIPAEGVSFTLYESSAALVAEAAGQGSLSASKRPVRVATTGAIVLSGEQAIDGLFVFSGDRVLVKNQSDLTKNGIYTVSAGAWGRATDANVDADVIPSMQVPVQEGTVNKDSIWHLVTDGPITLGTTQLSFEKITGPVGFEPGVYKGFTIDKYGRVVNLTADPVPVSEGGTGATNVSGAQTNLGMPSLIQSMLDLFGGGTQAAYITDPDNVTRGSGFYWIPNDQPWANTPMSGAMIKLIHVRQSNGYLFQLAQPWSKTNRLFIREFDNGIDSNWSAWSEIWSSTSLPVSTLGKSFIADTTALAMRNRLELANSATILASSATGGNSLVLRDAGGIIQFSSAEILAAGGTPFLDFKNDGAVDYDARIILASDDVLNVVGVGYNGFQVEGAIVWNTGNLTPLRNNVSNVSNGLALASGAPPSIAAITSSGNTGNVALTIGNNSNPSASAVMAFVRDGIYGAFLGLDTDNTWKVGGWSMGNVSYTLWHAGNFDPNSKLNLSGGTMTGLLWSNAGFVLNNGSTDSPSIEWQNGIWSVHMDTIGNTVRIYGTNDGGASWRHALEGDFSGQRLYSFGAEVARVGYQLDWISTVGFVSDDPNLPYMRRTSDNTVYYLQRALGFSPVQQGGGANQGTNKVYIGHSSIGGGPRIQVDALDMGELWTDWNGAGKVAAHFTNRSWSGNGYQVFPGGFVIQWGETAALASDTSTTVTFPMAFPSTCLQAVACGTEAPNGDEGSAMTTRNLSAATMTVSNNHNPTSTARWIAVGC